MSVSSQEQIRQGLVNYIGALLNSSPFEGENAQQNVIAIMAEESLSLSKQDNGLYNIYPLKPLLRATVVILNQRLEELKQLPIDSTEAEEQYNNTINHIQLLIDNTERVCCKDGK